MYSQAGLKENVGAPLGSKPEGKQHQKGVKKQGAMLKPESGMKYTPPPNKPPPKLTEAQKKKNRAAFGFADAPVVKVGAPVRMLGGDKGKYKGGK